MLRALLYYGFLTLLFLFLTIKSFVRSKENEYVAIFRHGKLSGVAPPGLNIIIPFLDKPVKISVDQIPNWQTMDEDELKERVGELAQRYIRQV